MGIIKKLPQELVSKIAAGEVVTNPSAVVKELIENSIDAKATKIEVLIQNGGKSYIKVADNGVGMGKEDLLLSVERYATSKIESEEDLYRISSFGFRGEALASVAEVSRVVITTNNGNECWKLEVLGGKIVKVVEAVREIGTTVEVFDLFYNLPARRKFLSSNKIETRMVTEVIERYITSYPQISFYYSADNEVIYNVKTSDKILRFKTVFPEVKEVKEFEDGIFSGIISSPQYTRKNRTGQLFFVNGRYVIDSYLNLFFEKGYGEALVKGSHPYGVIFISLPPEKVDVNIHPQKIQVKFLQPNEIYSSLTSAVRRVVRTFKGYELQFEKLEQFQPRRESDATLSDNKSAWLEPNIQQYLQSSSKSTSNYNQSVNQSETLFRPSFISNTEIRVNVFIIKKRYILFEDVDGINIIDFHAAHERILYEKLKEKNYDVIQLLIPVNLKLSASMYQIALQNKELLENLGFTIEFKENKELLVLSAPSLINISQIQEVVVETLEEYNAPFNKPENILSILATKACKAAIKTGYDISNEDALKLIQEIKEKELLTCPHGRPIMMKIPFDKLDDYFGR